MSKIETKDKKELTLEEIQQGSFKILLKIKDICQQQNINYWLMYGTLIGAVRHKGFIPWDDDIDVAMLREDYDKFIEYCINHMDELKPLELMHYKTNDKYIYPIARLSDSRYNIKYQNAKDYGLGLFVDIYPMDYVDNEDTKWLKKLTRNIRLISNCGTNKFVPSRNIFKSILKFPYFIVTRFININKCLKKHDELSKKYVDDKKSVVGCVCWDYNGKGYCTEYMKNLTEAEFNGEKFLIPKNYDKVLTSEYGDYMKLPPESERIAHHFYSAYEKNN